MIAWQEEQLQRLLSTHSEHVLFEMIKALALELGFEYCAYGLRAPLPFSQQKILTFNNYPTSWQEKYQANNYLAIDPTVQHGMRSLLPVLWSDQLFAAAPPLWEDARASGLRIGWAQSCRSADGLASMLTLARGSEAITATELRKKGSQMVWLSQAAHVTMSRHLGAKLMPGLGVQLTPREIEVLRWTAEGKTSGEISTILNLAERTVNFHIANAMAKLDAPNKTAAVVQVALMGLL